MVNSATYQPVGHLNRRGLERLHHEGDEAGDYERISTQVLDAVPHSCRFAGAVDVYKLRQPLTRQVDYFDIPMPRTGAPIRVRLTAGTQQGQGPS